MRDPANTRGCSGKARYDTRAAANEAMASLRSRKRGSQVRALKSYHCPSCGGFHFGSDPKRRAYEHRPQMDKFSLTRRYWQLVRGEAD